MDFLRKFINLILYSSLWIAVCAAAQVQLTYILTGNPQDLDQFTLFVFSSTIGLYGVHRLVGIRIVRAFENEGRFAVIKHYKSHIIVYSIAGFIASGILFILLPIQTWFYLIIPIAISAAYVIPTNKAGKRLRDLPLVKIFLLAASWSMLTTTVPLLNIGFTESGPLVLIFIERFLFVFAITIPFDIRDMDVDNGTGLRTLPHVLGIKQSKILAVAVLTLSTGATALLVTREIYSADIVQPYSVFFILAALLIWGSNSKRSDYYYSGLLDGTMMLLYLLLVIWRFFSY